MKLSSWIKRKVQKVRCRFGFHLWQIRYVQVRGTGWIITEECTRCGSTRSYFTPQPTWADRTWIDKL